MHLYLVKVLYYDLTLYSIRLNPDFCPQKVIISIWSSSNMLLTSEYSRFYCLVKTKLMSFEDQFDFIGLLSAHHFLSTQCTLCNILQI